MLHKNCGRGTEAYKRAIDRLGHDELASSSGELCQYIVWVPLSGLGIRILSLRPLLRAISWLLLPLDFPLTDTFHWRSPRSYGNNVLKRHVINSSTKRKIVPFVRPCEDRISGLKLFDHPEELVIGL
ncbi:unnamed protein product [Arabis nemorensis]|uniref:Fucosyltransferase n=1 Tax=Arabis nemorensis TaxID=586526 RepID=A0A565APB3_9BRAS|nr:unnamed protein product [Arabis nemorensis]